MPIEVKTTAQFTVETSVPLNGADTVAFAKAINEAAAGGYRLMNAEPVTGGNQRDPYTIGVVLTFKKS